MITNNDKLLVFENFFVDRDLPKFKRQEEQLRSSVTFAGSDMVPTTGTWRDASVPMVNGGFDTVEIRTEDRQVVEYLAYLRKSYPTLVNKFKYFVVSRFVFTKHGKGRKAQPVVQIDYEDVEQFFHNMHMMMKELGIKDKDIAYYETLISDAKVLGQVALTEKLMAQRNVLMAEISLIQNHKVQYITEAEVVAYYKKAKHSKNLHMTWVKNYARIIPREAVELKKMCDEKGWFDNYVVLHFDRKGDSAEMTNEEKRKAKDPILFGMIENSDKLYFVADWTDEYCDLTLDKMLKVIGKDALELNADSLKKRIEEIRA